MGFLSSKLPSLGLCAMMSKLKDRIELHPSVMRPDGCGGWTEELTPPFWVWAFVQAQDFSAFTNSCTKDFSSFRLNFPQARDYAPARFKVIIRYRKNVPSIAYVTWEGSTLKPCSCLQWIDKARRYQFFTAVLLAKEYTCA